MKELDRNSVESSELVEQTFKFWFNDNDHIRSPFPNYIQNELKQLATDRFYEWASTVNPEAKDEVNDEVVAEKFEEIIFETATSLIKTEDERITILYPFLPRLEDQLKDENGQDCLVKDRVLMKEGDNSYLEIKMEDISSKEIRGTKFELPV